ncbi:NADH dehydrogenase [ubiquinone] 1 alpha subcomplex subunit 3-like [Trachypithecus francoisi]|uniref:NADH dehydrogenase [ubiquinone] 1 alpha subcomplex subunit 3-like n=1 Tax=Trachypithecus francoisi TaxID=54180 RepID=UPI00141AF056|nr:NADH dehydrogenase [ubiquinone] 1 alpha subcomplex subunit 3-like [Trachypithecus francoisi]
MVARLSAFLRNAWAKKLVLVVSFIIRSLAVILPPLSPYTKYFIMINEVTPYHYPMPIRNDGNMPDVPSHPQDPQSPSLEWLKKLSTSTHRGGPSHGSQYECENQKKKKFRVSINSDLFCKYLVYKTYSKYFTRSWISEAIKIKQKSVLTSN